MTDIEFSKTKMLKYLIWTFAIAWSMQVGVGLAYNKGYTMIGQMLMVVMMFVPLLGVLFAKEKIKNMGWKLQVKRNIKVILIAWLLPALLTAIGAAIYFLIFQKHFDLSGAYIVSSAGEEMLEQLKTQGITYPMYVLISIVSCLTYAPVVNTFFAVGEEVGWRGFLYPQLKAKYGRGKGVLFGGVIWGMWHWPIIWFIGYEYGTVYIGFPVIGMIVFCVFTVALGILCDWLYGRSKCIWVPSLCHGAINAVATIPLTVCTTSTESMRLLGPALNGLLAGIPLGIFAGVLLFKVERK